MGLILRYLLRNIREKKGRSVLIVLSVALSSALFLATAGMGTTMTDMFARRLSQYFGSAQIQITSDRDSPSWLHSPGRISRSGLEFAYAVPSIQTGGRSRDPKGAWADLSIRGFDLEGLNLMAPPLWAGEPPADFRGNQVVLGEHSAGHFAVERGDSITVVIGGAPHRLQVAAVARSTGLFTDDGRTHTLVVPLDTLGVAVAGRGRSSVTYLRSAGEADRDAVESLMAGLEKLYPRYEVRETVPQEDIDAWTRDATMPFTIMSFMVFFMTVFIIFTCFRVITLERLPVMGTFRSVGATRRVTAGVLLAESIVYGLAGGLPGIPIGLAILRLLMTVSTDQWMRAVSTQVIVTVPQVAAAIAVALLLSVGSAAIPVLRAARLPIKDVVLGTMTHKSPGGRVRYAIGVSVLTAAVLLPHVVSPKLILAVGSSCIFLILIGTVLVLPAIVRFMVNAAAAVNRRLFGNIGVLAAKNLRDDPSVINNIALLMVGIASLFMITTMSLSAARSLTEFFSSAGFDIWMWTDGADRRTESRLRGIGGVTDIKGVYDVWDVEIDGTDRRIRQIQGITGSDILDWWDFPVHGGRPEELLDSLEERRSLVLSVKTGRLLDVEAGDSLTLMLGQPPRPRTYTVTGFFSSPDDSGGYALAGARWLKTDTGRRAYGDLWIKAPGRADEVKAEIEQMYRDRPLWVTTVPELAEVNAQQMRQIFLMLQFFSLLAVLIASVGIVNNYLVSYIERRRILAVIRSTGMSRAQASKMLLVEAFNGGFIGALIGLGGALAVASFLPAYMHAFDLSIILVISPVRMVLLMVLGSLLSLGAQVLPSYRSRTLNLVEALKYE